MGEDWEEEQEEEGEEEPDGGGEAFCMAVEHVLGSARGRHFCNYPNGLRPIPPPCLGCWSEGSAVFVGISWQVSRMPQVVLSRPLGGRFGASWGLFWASWGPLLGLLGPAWGLLGASWGLLGASWGPLGGLWGPLGALLGPPGAPGGGKLFLRLNCWSPSWPFLGTSEPDGVRTCACPLVATSPAAALPPPPCAGVPRGASAHRARPGPTGAPPLRLGRARGLIR